MEDLKLRIAESVKKAQQEPVLIEELYTGTEQVKKNQFLFFIKPEITQKLPSIKFLDILNLIFDKLDEFGFTINSVRLLGAKYLNEYDVIAQHYGVINQLSRNAFDNFNSKSKQKFEEIFNQTAEKDKIWGSLQFLEKHKEFTAELLNAKWVDSKGYKLGGGTYICRMNINDKEYFVVNGFHPLQLEHFTKQGRSIVAFTITSDTDWSVARNDFIGATNPTSANPGSLRKILLEKMGRLGLPEIDGSKNGVHLSAGPVEALVELIRFNSDLSNNTKLSYKDFRFGDMLSETFPFPVLDKILSNATVLTGDQHISVFDLTEEKNSMEAIGILRDANF